MSQIASKEKASGTGLTVDEWLKASSTRDQLSKVVPSHLSPDHVIRVTQTALVREPKLKNCTPSSFAKCLLDLAAAGLEPDGRNAHLVPFKNGKLSDEAGRDVYDCTLIIDYKGYVELVMRSGRYSYVHADVICENDEFEYNMGQIVKHKIDLRHDRGKIYGAYAIATFTTGFHQAIAMPLYELEAIRNNSQGYKAAMRYKKPHAWIESFPEMCKKTAFRRLQKWLSLSAEIHQLADVDEAVPEGSVIETTASLVGSSPIDNQKSKADRLADMIDPDQGSAAIPYGDSHDEPAGEMVGDYYPDDVSANDGPGRESLGSTVAIADQPGQSPVAQAQAELEAAANLSSISGISVQFSKLMQTDAERASLQALVEQARKRVRRGS